MTVKIIIRNNDLTSVTETKVMHFRLRKDAYMPYATLTGKVKAEEEAFERASEIMLYINGSPVFHGLIDSYKVTRHAGARITTFTSRSFTSLLCQNQIEPGLKSGITLTKLMSDYYSLPYVLYERNNDESYIYVSSSSTMWDAVTNLSYKLYGTYPYIRGTNTVRITPHSTPSEFEYKSPRLITSGSELTGRRMISRIHMADMSGNYGTYVLNDAEASSRMIVRNKYFDLDMEFLYDPQQSLEYHDKYAMRGWKRYFCSYNGYNGEDLSDEATFGSITKERIGRVEVTGSNKGVITEISVYRDKFPHS